jgi:hypothetical protein|tara:strand:+ start:462 stop:620 length:159 start_codon:yes stop_codon:yes gene_type:complete
MAKKGRKRSANPNEQAVYMRGYRAGYKKGLTAPGLLERTVNDMFNVFKGRQA